MFGFFKKRFEPSAAGHTVGNLCLHLLRELTPDTLFDSPQEALRFRFAAGTVIVMFAKQITAAIVPPQFVQAMCDAIEDPFYLLIKNLDPAESRVEVLEFLPDEAEREVFCRFTGTPRSDLADLATYPNLIYSALYPYRERLYYQDLQAAATAAQEIRDGAFSFLGVMVFIYKRLMLHVYGIKSDMRNRFIEKELFNLDSEREHPAAKRSVAVCGMILSQSYDILRTNIEKIAHANQLG